MNEGSQAIPQLAFCFNRVNCSLACAWGISPFLTDLSRFFFDGRPLVFENKNEFEFPHLSGNIGVVEEIDEPFRVMAPGGYRKHCRIAVNVDGFLPAHPVHGIKLFNRSTD